MLLILSLPILVIILPSLFFSTRNNDSVHPLPPSPAKLPIIGNLHQLTELPHRSLRSLSDRHGPLMLLRLGSLPVLVASCPSVVREITQTHEHLFANRSFLKATNVYHGRDIAFAPYGEYWREMRKMTILHLLNNKKVKSYKQARKEEVAFMIKQIEGTTVIDMSKLFNALSRDVISRAVFGATTRRIWWGDSMRSLISDNLSLMGEFHVGDYIPWLGKAVGFVSRFERRLRKTFERTDKLLEEIVREQRRMGMEKRQQEGDGDGANECFLHVLLTVQEEMKCRGVVFDDTSIKAITKDMLIAGTDSTSIPMEWAMVELLRHPIAMKKLKEEITNVVGCNETVVKEEQLAEMSYLKAIVKEVLRLHPPTTLIVRRLLTGDTIIKGYRIPKGTMVFINAWAIGRDPKIWDSPEEFRPERFINGEGRDLGFINHGFQLLAFGAGTRSCPGIQFSVSLIELAIANLVHVFDWKPAKGEVKDIDMGEVYGLTTRKREALLLIATMKALQN
ncbi:cytochrome P450 71A21-like [Phalaenopsis equestris]|uniref:cytochrome P450 71A21-like n=1 Tax=Phalaenopsis equestris TaxID=78828 RepID=UPI0009E2B66C|nr:cytochrome P450 71A21-like [Phalaenopsis equestris]